MKLATKGAEAASASRIAGAMSVEDIHLADVGTRRKRILVYSEPNRVWEVGAQLTHKLENASVVGPRDGQGGLQGGIRDEACCVTEWCRVCLGKERCDLSRGCWTRKDLRCRLKVVWNCSTS